MNAITRDPLLAVAKGLLWFLMAVLALGIGSSLLAAPLLAIFHAPVSAVLAEHMEGVPSGPFLWAIVGVLLLAALLCALVFRLFQLLKRIVDTVGEGDPFVPDNASRLTQMAWLTLAVQLVGLPMSGFGAWINALTRGHGYTDIEGMGGIDGNGLLLMLILFILARVFRKGAQMRADLEGMV